MGRPIFFALNIIEVLSLARIFWSFFSLDLVLRHLSCHQKVILENSIISSAKKIGRPILVNLPTYYVRFWSDHAQPTYLPKIGRH